MPQALRTKLYAKLGISPDASPEAIEAAYRVLERAYRPDGAYADDVMHRAFIEISSAAAILGNPRTRRLYDRNYIDESGRPTPAGLARAARARKAAIFSGGLSAAVAGLFILNFWGPAPEADRKSVQAGPPPQQAVAKESRPAVVSPSHEPAAKTEANEAANGSPSGGAPIREPTSQRWQKFRYYSHPPSAERHARRFAGSTELGGETGSSGARAPGFWERDIRSPDSRPQGRIAASDSATLKSAQCLACLTSGSANCSRACP
jgi:curved DNA-binding protein CbpA